MADLKEKLMQALDAERPVCPETQYDIGYNNGLTMAMAIVRNIVKDTNVPSNITEQTAAALNRLGTNAHGGESDGRS